ncbi:MAG: hypothetical protein SWQ30_09460 [Thermodesulfobacteriota bacterium]|nr:hypothetical protein [Thermodesulfobacteriota bacterium]
MDKRTGKERRVLPRSRSIYEWNFDPSGNWWQERRSGDDRRGRGADKYQKVSSEATTMNTPIEQRQYARFQVPGLGAYAVFRRHWPRSPVMGEIVDVGNGGLSFCYATNDEASWKPSELDILLTDGSFSLNRLPFKPVSDVRLENHASLGFAIRRCGVQFQDLTDHQRSDLMYFIQAYTTADPEA